MPKQESIKNLFLVSEGPKNEIAQLLVEYAVTKEMLKCTGKS